MARRDRDRTDPRLVRWAVTSHRGRPCVTPHCGRPSGPVLPTAAGGGVERRRCRRSVVARRRPSAQAFRRLWACSAGRARAFLRDTCGVGAGTLKKAGRELFMRCEHPRQPDGLARRPRHTPACLEMVAKPWATTSHDHEFLSTARRPNGNVEEVIDRPPHLSGDRNPLAEAACPPERAQA
jgi:hypothetical protein